MNFKRLSGLNDRDLFSHVSENYKSAIKMSAGLVSPGTSVLGL